MLSSDQWRSFITCENIENCHPIFLRLHISICAFVCAHSRPYPDWSP